MNLAEAQEHRRARGEAALDAWIEERLDAVGLSEEALATADVSPADRKKLKGIVGRLRTKAKPFTTCMNDLRKNHPEWSEERRRKTCGTLKALTGRKNGGSSKSNMSDGECVLVDAGVMALLDLADLSALEAND